MGKAICLLSGGQDSATCLAWALKNYDEVETINFDYGQRHSVEMECAKKISEKFGVKLTTLKFEAFKQLGGYALTDDSVDVKSELNDKNLPNTFVPGRNIIFLTLAAAYAYQHNFDTVVTGVCETDYSGYPDCREETMVALEVAIALGMNRKIKIETPLMYLTKSETVRMAEKLGCLETIINDTHTCYEGDHTTKDYWGFGCGKCGACSLRKKGFDEYGLDTQEAVDCALERSVSVE